MQAGGVQGCWWVSPTWGLESLKKTLHVCGSGFCRSCCTHMLVPEALPCMNAHLPATCRRVAIFVSHQAGMPAVVVWSGQEKGHY